MRDETHRKELYPRLCDEALILNEMSYARFSNGRPLTDDAVLCQKTLLDDLYAACNMPAKAKAATRI